MDGIRKARPQPPTCFLGHAGTCSDLDASDLDARLHPSFLRMQKALSPGDGRLVPVSIFGSTECRLLLAQALPPTVVTKPIRGACRAPPGGAEQTRQTASHVHTHPACTWGGPADPGPHGPSPQAGLLDPPGPQALAEALSCTSPGPEPGIAPKLETGKVGSWPCPCISSNLGSGLTQTQAQPTQATVPVGEGGWGAGSIHIHRHAYSANNRVACLPSVSLRHSDLATAQCSYK